MEKNEKRFLNVLDSFDEISGTEYEDFKEALIDLSSRTSFETLSVREAAKVSFEIFEKKIGEDCFFYAASAFSNFAVKSTNKGVDLLHVKIVKRSDDILHFVPEDAIKDGELILFKEKTAYAVNPAAVSSLSSILKTKGIAELSGIVQMLAVAQGMEKNNRNLKMVYRESGLKKKIYSFFTTSYSEVKLENMLKLYERMTMAHSSVVRSWKINNFIAHISIEFPELAEDMQALGQYAEKIPEKYREKEITLIPGIRITSSDTGHSSLAVTGTFRIKGKDTTYVMESKKRKHIGLKDDEIEELLVQADNEILSDLRRLPERLCELMLMDLTDENWNLSTKTGQRKNKDAYKRNVKKVMKDSGLFKLLGKNRCKQILEDMLDGFDEFSAFTAYDVAMDVLSIAEHMKTSGEKYPANMMEQAEKACGTVPYADFVLPKSKDAVFDDDEW